MLHLTSLAATLQALLTFDADFLAKWSGLIRRRRVLTGSALAQALVFHWMANPSAPLEEIATELGITPQALQQHLGPRAHRFFQMLIARTLERLAKARFQAQAVGLLRAFPAVVVEDATTVHLPASLAGLFPGCGNQTKTGGSAAVKILLRYELTTGKILNLSFQPGRARDIELAAGRADLPPGSLYLADLGFFSAAHLAALGQRCHWITRIPASTCVCIAGKWMPLAQWLGGLREDGVDLSGKLVQSVGTACRLVALRCPAAVAAGRRRRLRKNKMRKEGKEPTQTQLTCCEWTVLASNVNEAVLKPRELWLVYRCRWQIELLFKRAKGLAGWSFSHGRNGNRVLTELLAKVLGLLVLHWGTLLRGPALTRVNATALMRTVVHYARELKRALNRGVVAIQGVLGELLGDLLRVRPRAKRRRKPNTLDLLANPGIAAANP
jgi:Transposase DDE domain